MMSYLLTHQEKKPEPTFSQVSEVDVDVLSIHVRNNAELKDTTVGRILMEYLIDKRSKNTEF